MKKSLAVTLVVAAIAFWAGGHSGGKNPPAGGERTVLYYVDPMTPGFRSDQPGIAPCGMPLEPVYAETEGAADAAGALPPGAVRVSSARQQLIGVKTAPAAVEPMTWTLRLYGRIVPDETRLYRLNASTDSWIRTLADVTTGSLVRKDQILAEALAPAFYNAQVTYLIALGNVDRIREQLGGQLRHQQADLADNQIRLAVQALQNLGITDAQVEELANTRKSRPYLQVRAPADGVVLSRNLTLQQWFRAGEEFYRIADLSRVWVYADVYENEARHLRPGTAVTVRHEQLGKSFQAKVSEVLPLFDPVSRTLKVRLDVDNPDYDLRPDMFVDVEIPVTLPPSLHLPADAVIDSGTRAVVYVDLGDGTFEPRPVETGWKLGRRVEVTGGLAPGEKVVVSGNFLLDSESRMKTAAAGVEPRTARDPVCGAEVDEYRARREGRFLLLGDASEIFCSQECLRRFHAEPGRFQGGDLAASPVESQKGDGSVKDLVCGMQVDPRKAEGAGMYVTLQGATYHFCSRDCMLRFLQEHQAYAVKSRPAPAVAEHAGMTAPSLPETPLPVPAVGERPEAAGATAAPEAHGDDHLHGSPGETVDWDGTEKDRQQQDWSGWGKFPGAEYLGLHERAGEPGEGAPEPSEPTATPAAEDPVESPPHVHPPAMMQAGGEETVPQTTERGHPDD